MGLGNNIGRNVHLTLVANPITAASTVFDSAWIDCADYDGCMFTATYGAATTNMTVTVNYAASTTGAGTAVSGASVTFVGADDNKALAIDIYKPHSKGRYLRPVVAGMGAAGTIDFGGFVAMRYGYRLGPCPASTGLVDGAIDFVAVQST